MVGAGSPPTDATRAPGPDTPHHLETDDGAERVADEDDVRDPEVRRESITSSATASKENGPSSGLRPDPGKSNAIVRRVGASAGPSAEKK